MLIYVKFKNGEVLEFKYKQPTMSPHKTTSEMAGDYRDAKKFGYLVELRDTKDRLWIFSPEDVLVFSVGTKERALTI